MRNFIKLAATENFCQMVKYIVFYIQPLGMINTISEDLHRVVGPFTNLKSIIITINFQSPTYYRRAKEDTTFKYLLPVIKRAAACQKLQSLKIHPNCEFF